MDFDLNDEQRELRDAARRFLDREAPVSYARAMLDDERGYREDIWKQTAELGWLSLTVPEAYGGLGLGFIAQSILHAEMGRVVLPGPYFSTTLAGLAITLAGSEEQKQRFLPRIASGDLIATFAHEGHVDEHGGALSGARRFVTDGSIAECVVVVAHLGGGDAPGLFISEPTERTTRITMDGTRKIADLRFDSVKAERLGTATHEDLFRVFDYASVLLSAELLGSGERVLELATAYAKERVQFGKPIGSFQAVKHRLADTLVDVESMRNAVYYAAWALERNTPDATLAASIAKAFCSDAGVRAPKSAIQVHGGIGFTWEHDLHLYLKRALASAASFGDASHHRERVARLAAARVQDQRA